MQVGELKSHRQVDTQQLLCLWLTFNSNRGWEIPQKNPPYCDRDKDEIRHWQSIVKYTAVTDNYSQTKHWKKRLFKESLHCAWASSLAHLDTPGLGPAVCTMRKGLISLQPHPLWARETLSLRGFVGTELGTGWLVLVVCRDCEEQKEPPWPSQNRA